MHLGRSVGDGEGMSASTWLIAVLAAGAGWILLELAGSAALEFAVLPFRALYHRFVPDRTQARLGGRVGGPILLLCILVLAVILTFAALQVLSPAATTP